jgi:spore germination protein Q
MVQYYQYPFVGQQPVTVVPQGIPTQGIDLGAIQSLPPAGGSGFQVPFIEQSYIENILRLNRGKEATVYMNFENSQFGSQIFKGTIEEAGRDHLILKDSETGMTYLLPMIWFMYATFDEDIDYDYPIAEILQQIQQQQQQQFGQDGAQPQVQQAQPQTQAAQPSQQPMQQQYSYSQTQSQSYQRNKAKPSQKKK